MVVFTPRFVVNNKLDKTIQVCCFKDSDSLDIPVGQMIPLRKIVSSSDSLLLQIRMPPTFDDWSAPFSFSAIGKSYVKLDKLSKNAEQLVCIDVTLVESVFFITIGAETNDNAWPFRIDNESKFDIICHQTNAKPRYKILKGQSMLFAWDQPAFKEPTLMVHLNGFEREVNIQEIGPLLPFSCQDSSGKQEAIAMDVVSDGPTFVLKLHDWTPQHSIYRKTQKSSKSPSNFEVMSVDAKFLFGASIKLAGVGVSLIDRSHRELLYASLREIEVSFRDTDVYQSIGARIKWIQADNQITDCVNPIILYPTVIGKEEDDKDPHHAFQLAIVRSKDESYGVDYYKYFTCLLQELSIDLEEEYLFELADLFKFDANGDSGQLWDGNVEISEPQRLDGGQRMYFEVLQIQPMKFNLSFYMSERKLGEMEVGHNPISYAVNVLSLALGNISDAPIKLHALIVENPIVTTASLLNFVTHYYTQEVIGQIHKIIGSADFLGNPVGLFSSIGSGVKDVFYEPYQGFVSDRPQDFGIGLAKGTKSFLKKTVFGFSDTFTKFTGSVGKGLASATMDPEFQEKRKNTRARNKPRHAGHGVAKGAASLAQGFASGFVGMIDQPRKGAENGVGGFLKGIGKGLVGVVTKPIVGVFDMASNVTEGIRNSTGSDRELDRIRLPRFVGQDGVLKPYDTHDALGSYWLLDVENGKYERDFYVTHLEIMTERNIVFVTNLRVIFAHFDRLDEQWQIPFSYVSQITIGTDGKSMVFKLAKGGRQIALVLPDSRSCQWLYSHIHTTYSTYRSELGE